MTTTTNISGEVQGADVGQHATGGTIAGAEAAVNARVVETTTTISAIEAEAQQEIAQETSANPAAAQGVDTTGFDGGAVLETAGTVLDQIDLGKTSIKDIAAVADNNARSFEDDMKAMSKSGVEGFVRQAKSNTTTDVGSGAIKTGAGVAGGIAGTKLGAVSASLDGENGVSPKAAGGNLKGGNTLNSAQTTGLGRTNAPANAPRMTAAPSGPGGMGGGAQGRLAMARSSVDVNAPKQKIGEIEREKSMRGDAPGTMSRTQFEGQKQRDAIQSGGQQQPQTQVAMAQQVKNPFLLEMDMNMAPKPPSNIEGEFMGGGNG